MANPLKLVELILDGDLVESGFKVFLAIYEVSLDDQLARRSLLEKVQGFLPASPELNVALAQWRDSYCGLGSISRGITPEKIELSGQFDNCRNAANILKKSFLKWLASDSFRSIEFSLRNRCSLTNQVQILLATQDKSSRERLQHLPWHLWPFVDERKNAEVAFQADTLQRPIVHQANHLTQVVKVLVILGYSQGIDIERDLTFIKGLADVTLLREPTYSDVGDQLWEQTWDILFFAGHSQSQLGTGKLYLNSRGDYLTIEELRSGLEKSVERGLKLAIFNSCDGLGLAYELERLCFPQMIVMKEPIPDQIAHKFLQYFLPVLRKGKSLYVTMRTARERLKMEDKGFPCASWLPVLFHNPATATFKWPSIVSKWQRLLRAIAISCLVALCVIGLRSLGLLQSLELKSYDHMMRLRPDHLGVDNRILVITIDQEDIAYQRSQGIKGEGSLSDQALLQILQKVEPYGPSVVASDVIHDFDYLPELATYLEKTDNFMGICLVQIPNNKLTNTIAPPPELKKNQLGFMNFPRDLDGKIRRQFLGMKPDDVCQTDYSLSFAIALRYLQSQNPDIVVERLDTNRLKIGSVTFQKFDRQSGGYELSPKESGGFQILTNYRPSMPPSISLREFLVLGEVQLKSKIPERMILIGVANGKSDEHRTPYDKSDLSSTAGVVVHSQMVSHLVSAVLGQQPILSWWSQWMENIWIFIGGVSGTLPVLLLRRNHFKSFVLKILIIAGNVILLFGICLFCLINGLWIPLIPACLALILSASILAIYFTHKPN